MMKQSEQKTSSRVYAKPSWLEEKEEDYLSSLIAGAILLSLVMQMDQCFFVFSIVFVSHCLTSDGGVNWVKVLLPLSGVIPLLFRLTYDVIFCLCKGIPL